MAGCGALGANRQGTARAGPSLVRAPCNTNRSHYRFAIGQDGRQRGGRGYDAGKKIKGRKRHIAVDAQGNLLTVVAHSAGVQDRVKVPTSIRLPRTVGQAWR